MNTGSFLASIANLAPFPSIGAEDMEFGHFHFPILHLLWTLKHYYRQTKMSSSVWVFNLSTLPFF